MSQQLSIPAGGGLLSLNLSALPQVAGAQPGGGSPLFTGFSSMMSDAVSETGIPGGAFLPPQGISLPQGVADQLNMDPEQIKQRLLNLAEMLGQQSGSGAEGEGLPADVMAELARALRNFAEGEIPELPEELRQKLEQSGAIPKELLNQDVDAQQVEVPQVDLVSEEEPAEELLPDQSVASLELDVEEPETLLVDSDVEEGVDAEEEPLPVDPQIQVSSQSQSDEQEEQVVEESVQQSVSDEEVELADVEAVESEVQVQLNAESEALDTDEEVVVPVNDPRRSPVAEAARQEFNSDLYRNKGESVSQVARAQNRGGSEGAIPGTAAPVSADADAEEVRPNRVAPQVAVESRPIEGQTQRNAPKPEPQIAANAPQTESIHKASDNQQLKPAAANFSLDKFESMLEASQKLMTKAAAGAEKIGDSPFAQRLDSATSSTNAVPQSVSQPTQIQKAVADANNLMMPQNVKINTPAWNNALAERAVMIAAQNTNVAQIQLDPPELGSLNIRVQITQDQVSLNFSSPHAHVRDAVEQSLPRLREMFAEQGLALSDASVSDQQTGGAQEEMAGDGKGGESGYPGQAVEGESQDNPAVARSVSLVDYYA